MTRLHLGTHRAILRDLLIEQGGVMVGLEPGDGTGDGTGDGYGYGTGDGHSDGTGDGTGDGDGYGTGDGYGYGDGTGDGYGTGDGHGHGHGDGYGDGDGDGYGDVEGYGYGESTQSTPTQEHDMPTPRHQIPDNWIPVTVSTDRRVFFGWLAPSGAEHVEGGVSYVTDLRRARNAIRWGLAGGASGLAERGPGRGAVLEPPCDLRRVTGVVCVRVCTPEAAEAWESWASVAESR